MRMATWPILFRVQTTAIEQPPAGILSRDGYRNRNSKTFRTVLINIFPEPVDIVFFICIFIANEVFAFPIDVPLAEASI